MLFLQSTLALFSLIRQFFCKFTINKLFIFYECLENLISNVWMYMEDQQYFIEICWKIHLLWKVTGNGKYFPKWQSYANKLQTKSVNLAWIVTGNLYYNIIDKTFRVLQKVKSYIYGWFQYVFIGTNTHLSIIIPKNDYFLKKYEIKCISTRPLCYVLSVTSF